MPAVRPLLLVLLLSLFVGCGKSSSPASSSSSSTETAPSPRSSSSSLIEKYANVRLDADVSGFSDDQKEMVRLFIEAAQSMGGIFWEQAYGNRDSLVQTIGDPGLRRFVNVNYGPWDRLEDNEPFIEGVGRKPPGANFYPDDVTKAQIETAAQSDEMIDNRYTMVRRLPDQSLTGIAYHRFFTSSMERAAGRLEEAAALAESESFARYLERRAEALTTGAYRPSERAWVEGGNSALDLVIGPIEPYEDQLLGTTDPCKWVVGASCESGGTCSYGNELGNPSWRAGKAAAGAIVLRKDRKESKRVSRYVELLPMLQQELPVPDKYRQKAPGIDAELGVYDVLYVAGDANAGPKPVAINLPNDREVREENGARRLQLKNARRAMFEEVLAPISDVLIAEKQRSHVTFGAVFSNTMFHEVAHGLGVDNTISDQPVHEALADNHTTIEETKADAVSLYLARTLADKGEFDGMLIDNYTSVLVTIFHSLRLGTGSPRGRASLIRFNYFRENGAVTRNAEAGTYAVRPDSMTRAVNDLTRTILTLQANGDHEAVEAFLKTYATMPDQLQADLGRLEKKELPVGITYEQGRSVLKGLSSATATR